MDLVLRGLRAYATPPAWLSAAADGERVRAALRREASVVREGRVDVLSCDVQDLRLKAGGWTGRYVVTVAERGGDPTTVTLTGVLAADGSQVPEGSAEGSAFGTHGWSARLTDPPLRLRPEGPDRKLPGLPRLTAPDSARVLVEQGLRTRHPGIRVAGCTPEVVRYRPGQRCTILCHLTYDAAAEPAWPRLVVAKAHRHGEGAHAHGALEALAAAGLRQAGVDVAEPLAYLPYDDVSLQSHLPQDRSLAELVGHAADGGHDALEPAEDALRLVASALATLHASPVEYGPVRVLEDEITAARAGAQKLAAVFPQLDGGVEPLLALVEHRAASRPADDARPAHGAFRPAQVRLYRDRVGLLDVDGFGLSEPAQDVGRFVGKLRLVSLRPTGADPGRVVEGRRDSSPSAGSAGRTVIVTPAERMATADHLAAVFLTAYRSRIAVSPTRVLLWETLDLVKTLLQSWSRARTGQLSVVLALLERRVVELRQDDPPRPSERQVAR